MSIAKRQEKKTYLTANDYKELEKDYWDRVDNGKGQRTRVEYAADVPTSKFGSGFGRPN